MKVYLLMQVDQTEWHCGGEMFEDYSIVSAHASKAGALDAMQHVALRYVESDVHMDGCETFEEWAAMPDHYYSLATISFYVQIEEIQP